MEQLSILLSGLGYLFILVVVLGIGYLFVKLLTNGISAISDNDD